MCENDLRSDVTICWRGKGRRVKCWFQDKSDTDESPLVQPGPGYLGEMKWNLKVLNRKSTQMKARAPLGSDEMEL